MLQLIVNFPGLIIVLFAILLLVVFNFLARQGFRPALRSLGGYESLKNQVGQAVESGGRVHVSLGPNSIIDSDAGVALAGLTMLEVVAETAAISDLSPVATTADPTAALVLNDTVRRAYLRQGQADKFEAKSARLVALDPIALAGGATGIIADDQVRANVLVGSFGPEVALIAEAGARHRIPQTVGSDRLEAQAVGYAMADHALVGEEVYVARAYLTKEPAPVASLAVEDAMRWLIVGLIIFGVAVQTFGLLR